jgi:hypothetical protein
VCPVFGTGLREVPLTLDHLPLDVGGALYRIDDAAELEGAQRIRFRIGVNLGDVIIDDDDIYGDGVNIAARLEAQAEPGAVAHKLDHTAAMPCDRWIDQLAATGLQPLQRADLVLAHEPAVADHIGCKYGS